MAISYRRKIVDLQYKIANEAEKAQEAEEAARQQAGIEARLQQRRAAKQQERDAKLAKRVCCRGGCGCTGYV